VETSSVEILAATACKLVYFILGALKVDTFNVDMLLTAIV
jgi:hypothetical protein